MVLPENGGNLEKAGFQAPFSELLMKESIGPIDLGNELPFTMLEEYGYPSLTIHGL